MNATGKSPTSVELEGVIIRADGTREELGVIAYHHKNPIKRILGQRKVRGSSILKGILGTAPKVREEETA